MAAASTNAWTNEAAKALLVELEQRDVDVTVERGHLVVCPDDDISDDEDIALRLHRDDLVLLTLARDDRTRSRVRRLETGHLVRAALTSRDRCWTCGAALPSWLALGPCGWCVLAEMIFDFGFALERAPEPLTADVLTRFETAIGGYAPGITSTHVGAARVLPFMAKEVA